MVSYPRICPKCGGELEIADISSDGFDVYECPDPECNSGEEEEE